MFHSINELQHICYIYIRYIYVANDSFYLFRVPTFQIFINIIVYIIWIYCDLLNDDVSFFGIREENIEII